MPKTNAHTLILVRTSPSCWDAEGRLCGETDVPATGPGLNDLTQAIRDAGLEELRMDLSAVLCGPDELSIQCASLVRSNTDTKIKPIEAFREINLGLWEGVLQSELGERFPSAFTEWQERPGKVAPPDGESLEDVHDRVLSQLPKALKKARAGMRPVAVVLRPYAWAAVNCWLRDEPLSNAWEVMRSCAEVQAMSVLSTSAVGRERATTKIA